MRAAIAGVIRAPVPQQGLPPVRALTYSTPSIVSDTLSLVMAVWLGTGIVVSFNECAYAMRST